MKEYTVIIADSPAALETAPRLRLEHFVPADGFCPETTAALVYVPGTGLFCRMRSEESSPRALVTEPDGDTYKDSCMEWFINCAPEQGDAYLNFEANPLGTLHCKLGKDRYVRQALPAEVLRPQAKALVGDGFWQVDYLLPDETIRAVFGKDGLKSGDVLKSNFYKCGDETATPHWGMWSEVRLSRLDFHRPDFFGTLIVK